MKKEQIEEIINDIMHNVGMGRLEEAKILLETLKVALTNKAN